MKERSARSVHPIGTPRGWRNTGAMAAAGWLVQRGLAPLPGDWQVEIALDVVDAQAPVAAADTATRFHLQIYPEEWGFYFAHLGRVSWIRVTDIAFVHGRDQHALLGETPSLATIGTLVRRLEQRHGIAFRRSRAAITSNLDGAEPIIRGWLASL